MSPNRTAPTIAMIQTTVAAPPRNGQISSASISANNTIPVAIAAAVFSRRDPRTAIVRPDTFGVGRGKNGTLIVRYASSLTSLTFGRRKCHSRVNTFVSGR
jgi:hypothetical protein